MKKIIILGVCLFMISACGLKDNKNVDDNQDNDFILEKVDNEKDYVYLTKYKSITYDNEEYELNNLIINIKSEDVDNINLELKSFVIKSFKDMEISDGVLKNGNIINYDYYMSDKFISVIQRYYPYIDSIVGEEEDNVYVISLDTGKTINNEDIIQYYQYDEDYLMEMIEEKTDSDDIAFTMMNIKNNGYKLYINDKDKLCVIFNEIDDNQSIRKELVLN